MEISPSAVAPVCKAGLSDNQFELTCNTSGVAHRWEFTVFPENMTSTVPIQSLGTSGVQSAPLTIGTGTSTFNFSRLSDQNSLPLISRILISPISSGLNGTVVNCFEGGLSSTEPVATTTVKVIDPVQFD